MNTDKKRMDTDKTKAIYCFLICVHPFFICVYLWPIQTYAAAEFAFTPVAIHLRMLPVVVSQPLMRAVRKLSYIESRQFWKSRSSVMRSSNSVRAVSAFSTSGSF